MSADFELKIRIGNVLWSVGCYTRLEVKLAEYSVSTGASLELTDLDVLGIRVQKDLSIDYLVADCTSNRHLLRSPIQRVFWLRGVMEFFGASKAYLGLHGKDGAAVAIPGFQRTVADRLGVTILNEDNLSNLERRLVTSETTQLRLSRAESWRYLEGNLATLSKGMGPLLQFRKHDYWMNESHQNLHALISLVDRHRKLFDERNRMHRALALDLLSLFAFSVLHMSAYALRTNPEDPENELRAYFYGGYAEMARRQAIVDNISRLIGGRPCQASFLERELQLDPEYLRSLFDLAFRLLNKPVDASQILRYLQVLLFETAPSGGQEGGGADPLQAGFSDVTKKLARDIAKFFSGATGLPDTLFQEIHSN